MDDFLVLKHFPYCDAGQLFLLVEICSLYKKAYKSYQAVLANKGQDGQIDSIRLHLTEHIEASQSYLANIDKFLVSGGNSKNLQALLIDIKLK
jgi:hypothetical protein